MSMAQAAKGGATQERLKAWLWQLMPISGLSGHEGPVRRHLAEAIVGARDCLAQRPPRQSDRDLAGRQGAALGHAVRAHGPARPRRAQDRGKRPASASSAWAACRNRRCPRRRCSSASARAGPSPASSPTRATMPPTPDEKYKVAALCRPLYRLRVSQRRRKRWPPASMSARPIVYAPNVMELAGGRIAGTSVDDRAGCAVMVEVARALKDSAKRPTVHLVFSVQEEFNLRGAVTAAQALQPDIAIQLDLMLATDTPDMARARRCQARRRAGHEPVFSFHGRGTLNGTIPHPALVRAVRDDGGRREDHPAAQRPYRRAHRFLLRAAGRERRRLDRSRLSRCATPIPRWRSAISPISKD